MINLTCIIFYGNHLTVRRYNLRYHTDIIFSRIGYLRAQTYGSIFGRYVRSGELRAPHRNIDTVCCYYTYIAIQSCTGIPAGRLRFVLQANRQHIILTILIQQFRNVAMERIIAKRPKTGFFPIDVHTGFTHGSVKNQRYLFAGRNIEFRTIPANAHIRQSAGTPCLNGCLLLKILCNGNILQIVVAVERSEDSPIVRYADRLPLTVVKLRRYGPGYITFSKFPILLKQKFRTLCLYHSRQEKPATYNQHS